MVTLYINDVKQFLVKKGIISQVIYAHGLDYKKLKYRKINLHALKRNLLLTRVYIQYNIEGELNCCKKKKG